ncbi:MAG TPA: LITAF-like zinc ribbon domain-containing protein [Pyrinomonadaceae bacterium]|nr:LITAF-like zinc ribbon domain-containing protein [Chloracidobacterium sp.]MBP9936891.1 LITAF-like zinc ribbon domain-containing protein [Pyrinomonadaceae bacterium]MBK7803749.1 LITAF-like zinc ribbon domain-containing protein [Chloracidobacterium sp.]MBK9439578.1 LITAF-like zinc ribbon domain-containing protein [Chloracidobacterium sp.]MBK9768511.1 LITAF-like zinc ribbon domain-containing protein [Chloracidobacterium sp.]
MIKCGNCGNLNSPESYFCRFCGSKFGVQPPIPQQKATQSEPFDYAAPRPYAWKTDEFSTSNEARKTIDSTAPIAPLGATAPMGGYRPQTLMHQGGQQFGQPYRCPHCMSQFVPRVERRISTAGWITFAVLLVFFFPLFWIGLLIKEDVRICPGCNMKIG